MNIRPEDVHGFLKKREVHVFSELKKVCEIPSPTFHEEKKMRLLMERLKELGLQEVRIDATGNATGKIIGDPADRKFVLISAHGDTACESPVPIKVEEKGGHLFAHGICDNTAGITAVLTFLNYLRTSDVTLRHNYLIAFTVGEEGLGAKRGMKGLMHDYRKKIRYAVNVESHDIGRVTNACVGQLRGQLKIVAKQKGAHSWRDFGEPNAVVILSRIISDFSNVKIPSGSTYNITEIKGGRGINAIPAEAECLFECRSEKQKDLDVLAKSWERIFSRHCSKNVKARFEILATTRAASLPKYHPMFHITQRVQRSLGIEPYFKTGNTDGDVPLARGIPTVTLGSSNGFATHSLEEHMEKDTYLLGIEQIIRILLKLDRELKQ
ncbi:MAG: M20/M25/M40 family metallo-hydrolase [Candidatus Peribacteraceae bacterium]|nr:M20/M25/M40 family metallo-hydrolase [Candidatus Peribacteraceae bacterium]